MHVRRYFKDAEASNPRQAQHALDIIQRLYDIEGRVKLCASLEEKLILRQKEAAPLLKEFRSWAKKLAATPDAITDTYLAKALAYVLTRWESATRFLDDPSIPLDNGAAERAIRPLKLGAKNWLFASSEVGADALATFYSLIYSARMHNIDPYIYIRDLCDRIQQPGLKALQLTPDKWKSLFLDDATRKYGYYFKKENETG